MCGSLGRIHGCSPRPIWLIESAAGREITGLCVALVRFFDAAIAVRGGRLRQRRVGAGDARRFAGFMVWGDIVRLSGPGNARLRDCSRRHRL